MDKYQLVKACLNSFIDGGVIPKFDYSDIDEFAFRHRISPVVKYVCSIENSIERKKIGIAIIKEFIMYLLYLINSMKNQFHML